MQGGDHFHFRGSLQFDAGFGTSPQNAFIVGALFRVTPIISEGTDLSLSLRGATRGFQVGNWGFAIDLGAYLRPFGPTTPPTAANPAFSVPTVGFAGGIVIGGPVGTQISLLGHAGMNHAYGASATFGIDLLRLTVYRDGLLQWWPNPLSAGARTASAR
jgi:hypothetical protein